MWFEFASRPDEPVYGGYASLEFRPDERVAWWSAAFVGAGWPLVAVRAHDVQIPARGSDLRTDGLWASVTDRTVAMEAFGAVLEDPAEAWGEERGDIVPFGFDLEWDDGEVTGEVLLGNQRIEVDATGSTTPTIGPVEGAHVEYLSPVKPDTVHALCRLGDRRLWVTWYDQTSLSELRTSLQRRPPD